MNAAILAGGRSRRFGRNKLIEPLLGKPLIQHVIDRIRESGAVSHVYLTVTPGRESLINYLSGIDGLIIDSYSSGPAGGVLATVKAIGSCLILGGDMPLINPSFIKSLINECLVGGEFLACTPSWSNYLEPLHTVYMRGVENYVEKLIAAGGSLQGMLKELIVKGLAKEVRAEGFRNSFMNVNSVEDFRRVEELLKNY